MNVCTLFPEGAQQYGNKLVITFKLRFNGPPPHPRSRRYAIEYEADIPDFLAWIADKFDVCRFQYQPMLLLTWEWEPAFENAMLDWNLQHPE